MRLGEKKRILLVILLFVPFLMVACNPALKGLKQAKTDWGKQDYPTLAAMDVSCKPSDEGCNQLHLIKGDACFRLSKKGVEVALHYACAVNHLQMGIAQTTAWEMKGLNLNRAQTYENLLESLRLLQDTKRGLEAEQLTRQLVTSATDLLKAEPGHLAGVYFLNSGSYTLLRSELLRQNNPQKLCMDIKQILQSLQNTETKAQGTKYAPNYKRLRLDVSAAKTTVTGCQ